MSTTLPAISTFPVVCLILADRLRLFKNWIKVDLSFCSTIIRKKFYRHPHHFLFTSESKYFRNVTTNWVICNRINVINESDNATELNTRTSYPESAGSNLASFSFTIVPKCTFCLPIYVNVIERRKMH